VPPAAAETKDTLTIDLVADVSTMDPQLQWDTDAYSVYRNIFDNLLTRDTSGKIVPQVATAWHYASDTAVVFDLRHDIIFQDGSKLTPADVVFSIKRITDPAFKSPQLSQFDQIIGAEVTGADQVTLHTRTPYPALLAQLVKLSIVPEAVVRKVGDQGFNQQPVGSGPYRLDKWQRGVQSVLQANESYWRGKPPFKTAIFRAVPDNSTRVADLRSGRTDLTRGLTPDDAQSLKSDPAIEILPVATERVSFLWMNSQIGAMKDKRVRQAIAMGIDRDAIIKALQQGYGNPVNAPMSPADFGYDPSLPSWPFDPARARALIKEAGAEGATLDYITNPVQDSRINEAIQQMLGEIGLKINITTLDLATSMRRRQGPAENAPAMAQSNWSCACQDADGVLAPLFRSGSIWAKYSNPELDKLVDAARATLDSGKRLALYREALAIVHEEVPGLGLFQMYAIYGARRGLAWTPTADEAFFVMDMGWKP
jgi:peptide/nickel transport system substrate-binding protein